MVMDKSVVEPILIGPDSWGVLGGTFDPVHNGHLELAQLVYKNFKLEKILFVPNQMPPHKQDENVTPIEDRLAMLELALKDYPDFEISRLEVRGDIPQYTIYTMRELKEIYPNKRLFFLLGSDNLIQLKNWRKAKELIQECNFILVEREGFCISEMSRQWELPLALFEKIIQWRITLHPQNVAASEIRKKIHAGQQVQDLVPNAVWTYIQGHQLYHE